MNIDSRADFDRLIFRTQGQIVVEPDGNPIRTIITGGKRIYTGEFQSRKNRRTNPWESIDAELPAMMDAEVRTDVKWWLAQPCRFEMIDPDTNKTLVHIPDQALRLLDGARWQVVIREFKRDLAEVDRDPGYARKIEVAKSFCARIGWRYEVFDIRSLGNATRRENVRMIAGHRHTKFGPRDIDVVRRLGEGRRPFAYGEACEALGGFRRGKKTLHALMVDRIVAIPLDRVIVCDTPVALIDRSAEPPGGQRLID